MLVIRRLFGTGTNCIAPSGLPLLLCLFPGLAPWAFLSRPCGASFAPETRLPLRYLECGSFLPLSCVWKCSIVLKAQASLRTPRKAAKRNLVVRVFVSSWWLGRGPYHEDTQTRRIKSTGNLIHCEDDLLVFGAAGRM